LLLTVLERLAERQPVVLVIEDMHWADRSTGDLLAFLVRNLRRGAVLLVVTFRSDKLGEARELTRLLAELGLMTGVDRLELPGLSAEQVAAQLAGILGRSAEPAVASAIYQRGGGNPLFTEALLNPDGAISLGVPWSLRHLLLAAVKELPEQAQQVLRVAAAGSNRVGHRLLATVSGLGDAALTAALRPAIAASVLVADGDSYAFRHELFREALWEDLLPGERGQTHRMYAKTLEADPSLSPDYLPSVQLAVHWRGAGEPERALRAAWAAAADARAAFAYAEQLQMLELVLELWDRVPAAARLTGGDRVAVAELAAEAAWGTGEPAHGLKLAKAALAEADGERRASLLLLRALLRREQLLPGQVDDLRAALGLARAPTRRRGEILVQLFWALTLQGSDQEARQLAPGLRKLMAQLRDEDFQAEALIILAILDSYQGDGTRAALQKALQAARHSGSGLAEVRAYLAIMDVLERQGEHGQAVEVGREAYDRSTQLALTRSEGALIAQKLAESLTSAGRWGEALGIVDEALARSPAPAWRSLLLLVRWQVAVARGELDTAAGTGQELRSLAAAAQAEIQRTLPMARLEIESRLAGGDLTGAVAGAGEVRAYSTDSDPRYLWPLLVTAMRACADAAAAGWPGRGDGELAGLRDGLGQQAARTLRPGPVEQAHATLFAAEAARASGRVDLAAWDDAAAAWQALGQPYPLAYALLRAAGAAASQEGRDAAAARLPRAAELAARLGAEPLLLQIRRLARRARIDLPDDAGGMGGDAAAPFGLTAREMEVLRLVAAGRSNQQIAADLFISPSTASVHVSNILGKLDVSSRVEAAAIAHRLHLTDPD
jgi:DNA-binding CsgD family transcriptional regulator